MNYIGYVIMFSPNFIKLVVMPNISITHEPTKKSVRLMHLDIRLPDR